MSGWKKWWTNEWLVKCLLLSMNLSCRIICQNTKHPFLFVLSICLFTLHALCHNSATVLNACFDTGLGLPCGCGGIEGPFPWPKNERCEGRHFNWWSDWSRITVTIVLNSIHYYFVSSSFCFFLYSRHHTGLLLMRSTTF